jgi:hypothetical protein
VNQSLAQRLRLEEARPTSQWIRVQSLGAAFLLFLAPLKDFSLKKYSNNTSNIHLYAREFISKFVDLISDTYFCKD